MRKSLVPDAPIPHRRRTTDVPPALSVSQLALLIKDLLAVHAPVPVRVMGEVSNFSSRTHWFFSLKDEGATIRCVCFASHARQVRMEVRDGLRVIARGRLDFFPGQGHLQLYVDRLEPAGLGSLEQQLRALMEELRRQGYFDEARKKPLPLVPRRVAVVTSQSGAALQDVINTAQRRFPACRLDLVDVRVQGAEAAGQVAAALEALSHQGPALGIEAIILTRGGGSLEDLWAFNERVVADAIYRCRLPVVAAIGHESDTTVAELVADRRASTPTQAVMLLLPDAAALAHQVEQLHQRLRLLVTRQVHDSRRHVGTLARSPLWSRPENVLQPLHRRVAELQQRLRAGVLRQARGPRTQWDTLLRRWGEAWSRRWLAPRQQLDTLAARLQAALPRRTEWESQRLAALEPRLARGVTATLQRQRQHLDALARQWEAINPQRVLGRGYSYTLGPQEQVLTDAAQVRAGEAITTVLAHGRLHSRVEGDVAPQASQVPPSQALPSPPLPTPSPAVPSPPPAPRARRTKPTHPPAAPGLFD